MKIFFVCIGLAIFSFISMFFITPFLNNIALKNYSNQLFNMKLPDNTQLIEEFKTTGKLIGNGNNMDFFACILVKSDLSEKELNSFFENIQFRSAKEKNYKRTEKEVILVHNRELRTKYLEHETVTFHSLQNITNFDGYYAFVIYDGGYSATFDIRGH